MVWTAHRLAKETGMTPQHITLLLRKGRTIQSGQAEPIHTTAKFIIGEQTSAGWIIMDEEADLFIKARSKSES